jgi:hypothetical protein
LKKRLLSAYNLEKRAPIQWGVTHEKIAIEAYCKTGGVTVVQTGKSTTSVLDRLLLSSIYEEHEHIYSGTIKV